METNCYFVGSIDLFPLPVFCVITKLFYLEANLRPMDANVSIGLPICPGPLPYLTEHPAMKQLQKGGIQNFRFVPPRQNPCFRFDNIGLFQRVQLRSGRDMSRNKPLLFLWS